MSEGEQQLASPSSSTPCFAFLRVGGRQFIARGYGVIYLGREGCAAPFARRFQELVSNHVDLDFMDKLVLGGENENKKQICVYRYGRRAERLVCTLGNS